MSSIWTSLQARFSGALQAASLEAALVHSGLLLPVFRDDQSYPFKPQAWYSIWGPLPPAPECFVYVKPGTTPRLLICAPPDFWYEPASQPLGDVDPVFRNTAGAEPRGARAALPQDLSRVALIGESDAQIASWGLAGQNPEKLLLALDFTRAVKTPMNCRCCGGRTVWARAATSRPPQPLRPVRANTASIRPLCQPSAYASRNCPTTRSSPSTKRAACCTIKTCSREPPAAHHSLLLDAGAQWQGYASDITRTVAAGTRNAGPSRDFAALIKAMDRAQQGLCAQVRAGVEWPAIHLAAHRAVATVLREADLIECDADEALASGLSGVFMPHGIGHLLGLQVHDVGGLQRTAAGGEIARPVGHPYLRLTRRLEAGFVVTMEPGLYFIDQLLQLARADARGAHINWPRVEQLRRFGGIRIEDDLAVSASGCENLTRDAFAQS